jgi:hypothetical protein
MSPTLEGGCACGALRYRLASGPMFVHCCHRRDCQRQTGSAFVLNALIETNRVEKLSGETRAVAAPTDSGRPHHIHRCTSCGTAMWSHYGGVLALSFVRVGTLDEPSALPPNVHIYTPPSCLGSRCRPTSPRSMRIMTPRSFGRRRASSKGRRYSGERVHAAASAFAGAAALMSSLLDPPALRDRPKPPAQRPPPASPASREITSE